MDAPQTFILQYSTVRRDAVRAVQCAPQGYVCVVRPAKRSLDQSAKFHAICQDLGKSDATWDGERQDADSWKFLLVSGHAVATKVPGKLMLGLEGERVMLRPSTAAMSVAEMASLIEYCLAWCAGHGIQLREPS